MPREIEKILKEYPLAPARILGRGGGTASPKYVILAGGSKYLLRKRRAEFSNAETILFDHSVIHRLGEEGFPVSPPEKTSEGKTAVPSGEEAWELFKYIDGLEDFMEDNEAQTESAGRTLGRFHKTLSGFRPAGEKSWKREFHTAGIKRELIDRTNNLPEVFDKKSVGRVLREIDFLLQNYDARGLSRSITHGDYTSANVKFKGNSVAGIFDFDWTMREAALYDVARGLAYFSAERKKPVDGADIFSLLQPCRLIPGRAELFLKAYMEEFKLPRDDILNLPLALKEFFIGSRVRGLRKAPDDRKHELLDEGLVKMLDEAEEIGRITSKNIIRLL